MCYGGSVAFGPPAGYEDPFGALSQGAMFALVGHATLEHWVPSHCFVHLYLFANGAGFRGRILCAWPVLPVATSGQAIFAIFNELRAVDW